MLLGDTPTMTPLQRQQPTAEHLFLSWMYKQNNISMLKVQCSISLNPVLKVWALLINEEIEADVELSKPGAGIRECNTDGKSPVVAAR